jgi:hypothetical protein
MRGRHKESPHLNDIGSRGDRPLQVQSRLSR